MKIRPMNPIQYKKEMLLMNIVGEAWTNDTLNKSFKFSYLPKGSYEVFLTIVTDLHNGNAVEEEFPVMFNDTSCVITIYNIDYKVKEILNKLEYGTLVMIDGEGLELPFHRNPRLRSTS